MTNEGERVATMEKAGLADKAGVWARGWVLAGAAAWVVVAVLARMGVARIGVIELMFLFGPLVIVPLGMELDLSFSDAGISRRFARLAQSLQPLGTVLVVVAICLPPSRQAGLLAAGCMGVCGLMAMAGAIVFGKCFMDKNLSVARATQAMARMDMAIGGVWLVASRLGIRPMGIREPIGLLTAVHFHFAGFATATIAGATLRFAELRGEQRWLRRVVIAIIILPIVVAIGFVTSPMMKMVAAAAFSVSVAALAGYLWKWAGRTASSQAWIFLRMACATVFVGMTLSSAYAVTDYLKSDALTIPRMASTHGVLNAVGFCMLGLLGWLMEFQG
jgi:hypothetical protein